MANEEQKDTNPKTNDVKTKRQPSAAVSDADTAETTKIISAQVHVDTHVILEKAQSIFELDKSGLVRLALLEFIDNHYQGSGEWTMTERTDDLAMGAATAPRMLRALPRNKRG